MLGEELPGSLSDDPKGWIIQHGVVRTALNEILGAQGQAWVTEKRPSTTRANREFTWIRPVR